MDEFLFISMAKLGADRLKEERIKRGEAPVAIAGAVRAEPVIPECQPTPAASRLAMFSLVFALGLAAIAVGIGIAATLERAPAGEVVVSEAHVQAATARDIPVINRPSFSMARSIVGFQGRPQLRRM